MNARERIAAAAGAGQPVRRWELDAGMTGTVRDTYERDDGYWLAVWFTRASSVHNARLTSPTGDSRRVSVHEPDKLDQVLAWLDSPASHFGPVSAVTS